MLASRSPLHEAQPAAIASLPMIATPVRTLDDRLWNLLVRPGPLTAEEWAYIVERERAGQQADAGLAE